MRSPTIVLAAAMLAAVAGNEAVAQQVRNATVRMSTEAAAAAAGAAFDPGYLTAWINNRLASDGLRVADAGYMASVLVKGLRVGPQTSDGEIVGEVELQDLSGRVRHRFEVSASRAFGDTKGIDKERMTQLYSEFSRRLAAELKNRAPSAPVQSAGQSATRSAGSVARPQDPGCANGMPVGTARCW